jgi:hypothetical protein
MGPYILASAVILAGAAVAVAYFISRTTGVVAKVPTDILTAGGEAIANLGATAGGVVGKAVDATEKLLQPISNAVGKVGESIADRLRIKRVELNALRTQVLTLTQEVEMLKSRRISIDQVKSILQLALVEAGFTRYNIKKMRVGGEDGGWSERDEEIEYFGIVKATYKQRLGVDLEKLKFQRVSSREIAVSGLGQTEIIGTHSIQIEPFHTELRRHLKAAKLRAGSSEIIAGDDQHRTANTKEREQNAEIIKEINEDKAIKEIDNAIDRLALSFLEACFAPAGYRVKRAEGALESPKSFQLIGAELNDEVEQLTRKRTEEISAKSRECHLIEGQVEEMIDSSVKEMKAEVYRVGKGVQQGCQVPTIPKASNPKAESSGTG